MGLRDLDSFLVRVNLARVTAEGKRARDEAFSWNGAMDARRFAADAAIQEALRREDATTLPKDVASLQRMLASVAANAARTAVETVTAAVLRIDDAAKAYTESERDWPTGQES